MQRAGLSFIPLILLVVCTAASIAACYYVTMVQGSVEVVLDESLR